MTAAPLRLFLVDDHTAFRKPLATVLEHEPDLTVVAQAGTLAEARSLLPHLAGTLDVALVDLQLPDGDGTDLIRALVQSDPQLRLIVLTADTDPLHHAAAIEAGATGIIGKDAEPADIIRAVHLAHAGEPIQPHRELIELLRLAAQERERSRTVERTIARLTPREREVLFALTEGLDNQAIADRLFISPETARAHVGRVLSKLGVESRLQAAIFAIRHGLGPVD